MKRENIVITLEDNTKERIAFIEELLEINKQMIAHKEKLNNLDLEHLRTIILPKIKMLFSLYSSVKSLDWTQTRTRTQDHVTQSFTEFIEIDELRVWLNEKTQTELNLLVNRGGYSLNDIKRISPSLYNTLNNFSFLIQQKRDFLFLLGESIKISFFREKIVIYNLENQKIINLDY